MSHGNIGDIGQGMDMAVADTRSIAATTLPYDVPLVLR